jgi:hypothetical protein
LPEFLTSLKGSFLALVGPLPTAQGNYKYAVVAIEYFTKWIDVKPLVNVASTSLRKLF